MAAFRSCIFILFLFCNKAFAQAEAEANFVKLYRDSTEKFNTDFTDYIKQNPSTFHYSFKKLDSIPGIYVITSANGRVRLYSWDTQSGGTMHFYRTICQWESNGKVFTDAPVYEEGNCGSFCSAIYTVQGTYYLIVNNSIFSNKDMSQSITACIIKNNDLVPIDLFKTKKEKLSFIDVEFDFFSVVDRPERPLKLIKYDEKTKTLFIPVVNDKGEVTKRNLVYQWKGNYFEYIASPK